MGSRGTSGKSKPPMAEKAGMDGLSQSEAASRAIQTLIEHTRLLEMTPRIGRPMDDETERRELVVPFASGAYIVRYYRRKH
jgi:plasmid stabilization system protein ParE